MKLLFLAAAAAIAIPAAAQTTPDPATQDQATMPTDDSAVDQTTPAPATATAAAPSADAQDPAGGYEPSAPPMNGTPEPGANVVFQPSASPDQAFPPPPPLAEYPICKKNQTDNCRQRGG
ncbi:hypothetical protein DFR49_1413 [Hephaestia caeni]|uniref:Fe-S oxidoreductase n=1 Tax=Hephaestia caeni TaxID=645617 RepID=A0A397PEK6_9SPHN|nr:hypothetical protein [Hephaestia caeni]RIA46853.1 hypothetical protein DFR49_1413 [Hephaestia caeni]